MSEWYQIESNQLVVQVTSTGAEMKRLFNKIWNRELLWQGEERIWKRSAPLLFPIVGKLDQGRYFFDEKEYQLDQHGFARDLEFVCIKSEADEVQFLLGTTKESFLKYPFLFNLIVTYKVEENQLHFKATVKNIDQKDMYFSFGWHPAFDVRNMHDSDIELEKRESKYLLLEDGLLDLKKAHGFENNIITLEKDMFKNDAMILPKPKSKWIAFNDRKLKEQIKMNIGECSYFGIWGKDSIPFICLEPWMGVTDLVSTNGNLKEKHGILKLKSKSSYDFHCTLEFNKLTGK